MFGVFVHEILHQCMISISSITVFESSQPFFTRFQTSNWWIFQLSPQSFCPRWWSKTFSPWTKQVLSWKITWNARWSAWLIRICQLELKYQQYPTMLIPLYEIRSRKNAPTRKFHFAKYGTSREYADHVAGFQLWSLDGLHIRHTSSIFMGLFHL